MTKNLSEIIRAYAARNGRDLVEPLGTGVQGSVWRVKEKGEIFSTAVKAHRDEFSYRRERNVYLRLREYDVAEIRSCSVPYLLNHDDELMILEMGLVQRPFILDFGGAYLDYPPDFSDDVLAEWEREKREQYGSRWPEVQAILRELEKLDIYMVDVHPGNISFG
jgi:hypothetical protein